MPNELRVSPFKMSAILVTGANKGIGLAVCKAILQRHQQYKVLLGSRSESNADSAIKHLEAEVEGASKRLFPILIDVSDQASVDLAAKKIQVRTASNQRRSMANCTPSSIMQELCQPRLPLHAKMQKLLLKPMSMARGPVTQGVKRVVDAFLPLLDKTHGRIVNVGSGICFSCVLPFVYSP